MKRRYILYRRKRGGMFYIEDTETRKQESTGTRNRAEATSVLNARNESIRQPHCNSGGAAAAGLARGRA
jgi:hypothetical protein